jgi:glycosyltransferase involved in cell wall biosynthesis
MDREQKPLRMLYLSTARIPSEKAHAYQIVKMCEAFARQEADVTLLYQKRDNSAWTQDIHDVFAYYGVRVPFAMKQLFCFELPFLGERLARLQFYAGLVCYLAAAVYFIIFRRKSIDVIYCRDKFSLMVLGALTAILHIPVFYEAHDFPQSLVWLQFLFFQQTNGVIVLTEQLKNRFLQRGLPAAKILVAHSAVDLELFESNKQRVPDVRAQLEIPPKAFLIGYVGRFVTMDQEKGLRELIEAVQQVVDSPAPVYLACIGGPMNAVAAYLDLIDGLGLNRERFKFHDLVPAGDVPSYIAAFDLAAMPFPWTAHYAFNMSPLKMFEYMAAEKPIVATRLPTVMEVLKDGVNAVLVEPDNPAALAQGIQHIALDQAFARKIGENARRDVNNYTWKRRAGKILEFINSSMSEKMRAAA